MSVVPEALRQMLVKLSTVGHVHDLHPAADPQQQHGGLAVPDAEARSTAAAETPIKGRGMTGN
jgi:hypothetical protein